MDNKSSNPGSGEPSKRAVSILHLEDDLNDHKLIAELADADGLKCSFVRAESGNEFEHLIRAIVFDLILSDYSIPSYNGMKALAAAKESQPDTPFIFVSGTIGQDQAVASLQGGAVDYVLKDNLGRLVPAMSRALREVQERKQRAALEAQLLHSQKLEAIGRLATGVAHDFNNLLTAILNNAQLALMEDPRMNKSTAQHLGDIVAASERAAKLTRQLLAFGRKQAMQPESVNLNEVIGNLAKMLKRVIGADIRLESQLANPLPQVRADVSMIEQVLINLVINARDAMPEGGKLFISTSHVLVDELHARANAEARAGDFVCCTVRDTGTGILPEHLPHIFEPFFTTKQAGKGSGLGLATAHGIVHQHGGWMEVSTRVDDGTSFKFYLPVHSSAAASSPVQNSDATLRGGEERILLVEDDPPLRALTQRILEGFGYHVKAVATGREALEACSNGEAGIDLLLTDIILPGGMTGRELGKRLSESRSNLKVIFVSGYSADVARISTSPTSSGVFLQKPYSAQTLLRTVRESLDAGRTA